MYLTRGHLIGLTLAALVLASADPPARQGSPVAGDGAHCREFTLTATIGGLPERTVGTACRQADGSWRLQP